MVASQEHMHLNMPNVKSGLDISRDKGRRPFLSWIPCWSQEVLILLPVEKARSGVHRPTCPTYHRGLIGRRGHGKFFERFHPGGALGLSPSGQAPRKGHTVVVSVGGKQTAEEMRSGKLSPPLLPPLLPEGPQAWSRLLPEGPLQPSTTPPPCAELSPLLCKRRAPPGKGTGGEWGVPSLGVAQGW